MSENQPLSIVKLLKKRQEAEKKEDYVEYEKLSQELYERLKTFDVKEEVLGEAGNIEVTAAGMSVIMEKGKPPRIEPRLRFKRKAEELTVGNTLYGKKQGEI